MGGVQTIFAVDLVHGNNEQEGVGIGGVGNRVLEEADGTDNLGDLLDLVGDVGGVADDDLSLGNLALGFHSHNHTVLNNDLINRLVQHVGTSIDGAQPVEKKEEKAHITPFSFNNGERRRKWNKRGTNLAKPWGSSPRP